MKRDRIFSMALIALFTALTIIGTQISIPLPLVPITLQTMFVLSAGMLLGGLRGMLSQLLYVAIGLIGFPVFSRGQGGIQMVFAISFGYLLGFIVAPPVISWVIDRFEKVNFLSVLAAGLAGAATIDLVGIGWILLVFNTLTESPLAAARVFSAILLPTVPGDLLKAAVLALTIPSLHRMLYSQNLLPHLKNRRK